jgi:hypothetical protein
MPRHFGRMRVAGTVIWSTELIETRSRSGGRKGQPSVTTFSYTASFAVALSSTPIERIGRIWADGNLLRGAMGDLKVGGRIRIYRGHGDDPVDPLISAQKGNLAPAFRDCAYVVFEDLQLADFGNRIPALTFEIFAADGSDHVSLDQLVPGASANESSALIGARRFADEGGAIAGSLMAIDQVFPLICTSAGEGLKLSSPTLQQSNPPVLPEQLSSRDSTGAESRHRSRANRPSRAPVAVRYYDEERDYQPGVQRALGQRLSGRETMVDLPATMTALGARQLANDNAHRARWQHERVLWRTGELDPDLMPGKTVRLPGQPGQWLIRSWEWIDRGLELVLERLAPQVGAVSASDAGAANLPDDNEISATILSAIEVPCDGNANPNTPVLLAAATSVGAGWRGAELFQVQGNSLIAIGTARNRRSVTGQLAAPLAPSPGLLFEPSGFLEVELIAADLTLFETDMVGIAAGANRLMVGAEVLQFAHAQPLGSALWRLSGLLRGRGGTEHQAAIGHPAGTSIVWLDDRLTPLDPALVVSSNATTIAALGLADSEPVLAELQNAGLSRRPLQPVHAQKHVSADGSWQLCWTRRARGQWRWEDGIDVAVVEERENYLVGYGPTDSPFATWPVDEPSLAFTRAQRIALLSEHGPTSFWVRQMGTFAQSHPLHLAHLL